MSKCIILIVEGDTEVEFYRSVIAHIRSERRDRTFHAHVEFINVGGVGGFKNIALMRNLFRQAGKTYLKGMKCEGLMERLDIDLIMTMVNDQLAPLYEEFKA